MLSKRPGETFEPVTATRIGWNASRGFSSRRSASSRSRASIVSAVNGSTSASAGSASLENGAVEERRVGLDVVEEEAGELRVLAEGRDLLLDERRRSADQLLVPVVALLAEVRDEPVRVLAHRQLAQVDAVQPLELLEVEDRRARAHSVEGEALDELVAAT